jgi:HlyD family secretion protein
VKQAQAAYDRVKYQPDIQMRQEALNLETATISLEQAQANYDSAAKGASASDLAAAEAQVAQAKAQLAQLLDHPTPNELAAAEAQVAQAEAQLAQLLDRPKTEDVAVFQAQLQEAEVALAQAQAQLEDAEVTAPFAGAILAVQVREGEWAAMGSPAFVLAAISPLILDVNVDEVDVAQLDEGQVARISFDALREEQLSGTVTYIAPASTDVGGAVAYGVEVSFLPGELPVRLGMTADVDIVVASAKDALLVPNQAIESDRAAGRYYVNIPRAGGLTGLPAGDSGGAAEGSATERVEVIIGLRDESQTQVLEGLSEGSLVVLPQVPEQTQSEQRFGPGGGGGPFGGGQ